MHGGQAVPMFDYCMAPGVAKTYRKQYYKALGYYFNAMLDMKLEDASLLCKKNRTNSSYKNQYEHC